MDNGAEPKSWLPDGAAAAVADDESQSKDTPAAVEDTSADLDPVTYGDGGSYVYEDEAPPADGDAPDSSEVSADLSQAETGSAAGDGASGDAASEGFTAWSVRPSYSAAAHYDGTAAYEAAPADGAESADGSAVDEASPVGVYAGLGGVAGGTGGSSGYTSDMRPPADEPPAASSYQASTPRYQATTPQQTFAAQGGYGTSGVSPAGSGYRPAASAAAAAQPAAPRGKSSSRRANLVISRLEPWSVMKFSFLFSLVAWVVLLVAVAVLYYTLSGLGVFSALGKTLSSVTSSQGSSGSSISSWTAPSRVLGYTMLIGAFDVVVITALSTIGAMIYNLVSRLGGGIEVTLKEAE